MKEIGVGFVLSAHAAEQMLKRSIEPEWIELALANPDSVTKANGIATYQKILVLNGSRYLLRVVVNSIVIPNIVITAYITSKIKKYHESKI